MSTPFMSEVKMISWNFSPKGWAFCNGQFLPINQNQAMFSLLGTTYGGNGQTTFALPDLRGRVPVHVGQGPGLSNRDQGEIAGEETHILTTAEIPAHAHDIATHTHSIPALPVDVKASSAPATGVNPGGNVLAAA